MTVFFFNDTATTEIYTLSLHDALPIFQQHLGPPVGALRSADPGERVLVEAHGLPQVVDVSGRSAGQQHAGQRGVRSEEHTSELQSRQYLVCRLLLEKKKPYNACTTHPT